MLKNGSHATSGTAGGRRVAEKEKGRRRKEERSRVASAKARASAVVRVVGFGVFMVVVEGKEEGKKKK